MQRQFINEDLVHNELSPLLNTCRSRVLDNVAVALGNELK